LASKTGQINASVFAELYKRMGKDDQIQKQQAANIILKEVLKNIGVDNL
jgi:hypothetical protein